MHPKIAKAFKVSDGLANLAHKKVTSIVRELEAEGVLTKQEGGKVLKGLARIKKSLYDNVSGELKKIWNSRSKSATKKSGKKKKR